jgi:hypothetical protein
VGLLGLLTASWLVGLACFALADGHIEVTLPRRQTPPSGSHNLASWKLGPTVRASSYYGDWGGHHHPLFLVDGREHPSVVEKWASGALDRHPWVELLWREPHDLERVVLRHAGDLESASFTVHRYTIACLTRVGDGRGPSLLVEDNQVSLATHALACTGARGVRVDFVPNDSTDIVRVFELETWGQ